MEAARRRHYCWVAACLIGVVDRMMNCLDCSIMSPIIQQPRQLVHQYEARIHNCKRPGEIRKKPIDIPAILCNPTPLWLIRIQEQNCDFGWEKQRVKSCNKKMKRSFDRLKITINAVCSHAPSSKLFQVSSSCLWLVLHQIYIKNYPSMSIFILKSYSFVHKYKSKLAGLQTHQFLLKLDMTDMKRFSCNINWRKQRKWLKTWSTEVFTLPKVCFYTLEHFSVHILWFYNESQSDLGEGGSYRYTGEIFDINLRS